VERVKVTWFHAVRGCVTIRIAGSGTERLLSEAAGDGIELLALRRTSRGELECVVTVGDFFRLRPHLRRTGCRLEIVRKRGLPFQLARIGRRKSFAAGLVLFFIGLYALSSLVWRIEIEGNERLTDEEILAAARAEGLYPFQWSFRLPGVGELSRRLNNKLPGTAWVGVEKRGTMITIRVVESTEPETRELLSPRHLIAKEDAVITRVTATRGRPVVKKNQRVRKGDVLISGILGTEGHYMTVPADGTVRGLVWHEYDITSPLVRKAKTYTGERRTVWHAVLGGRSLQVSGFGEPPFAKYESVLRQENAAWRGIILPVGRIRETQLEVRFEERRLTEKEAAAEGLMQARADILRKAGADAEIRAEKILHRKTGNGKVYMKVLFEVEQSITDEMPLVKPQGE
jgi:similar to stage IV sporulation protein